MSNVDASKRSIIIAILALAGIVWAVFWSPGGRQFILLNQYARWRENNGDRLAALRGKYPQVKLFGGTDCRFSVCGTVPDEATRDEVLRTIRALRPPLEVVDNLKIAAPGEEKPHGNDAEIPGSCR